MRFKRNQSFFLPFIFTQFFEKRLSRIVGPKAVGAAERRCLCVWGGGGWNPLSLLKAEAHDSLSRSIVLLGKGLLYVRYNWKALSSCPLRCFHLICPRRCLEGRRSGSNILLIQPTEEQPLLRSTSRHGFII